MRGLNTTPMTIEQIRQAIRAIPPEQDFVWDGIDEDDRPATHEEMQAGIAADLKRRGRPIGSSAKEQIAIRFDKDIVTAFRATGKGWQTRMNAALREWLQTHSPA
jgi:uncharacterized protein (DUF4415 family)